MSRSLPVELGGVVVYAYVAEQDGGLRVRVSADEWDRLGLHEGQRVAVRLPGRGPADLLLTAATPVPPFVWLALTPVSTRKTG